MRRIVIADPEPEILDPLAHTDKPEQHQLRLRTLRIASIILDMEIRAGRLDRPSEDWREILLLVAFLHDQPSWQIPVRYSGTLNQCLRLIASGKEDMSQEDSYWAPLFMIVQDSMKLARLGKEGLNYLKERFPGPEKQRVIEHEYYTYPDRLHTKSARMYLQEESLMLPMTNFLVDSLVRSVKEIFV